MGALLRSNIQYLEEGQEKEVLKAMKRSDADGLYRKGSFANQIIWDNRIFYFHKNKKRFPMNTLFLFRLVKLDCERFLKMKKNKKPVSICLSLEAHPRTSQRTSYADS
jgi:hypothetical protein